MTLRCLRSLAKNLPLGRGSEIAWRDCVDLAAWGVRQFVVPPVADPLQA